MNKENFFELVYEVVRQIPPGRVTSYGAIAEALGAKGSSRMVGYAMYGCAEQNRPVPAHRVVNHKGVLSGKHAFSQPQLMQKLLESEGLKVENDRIVNFKNVFWHPAQDLEI